MGGALDWLKAHPLLGGIIAIVGGFLFIMIVRGGGGNTAVSDGKPTDAEVMAGAQVAAAQIAAQANASQAGAAIQAAQIGAGVQLNSDNKAAEIAMRAIDTQKALGLATIDAQKTAVVTQIQGQQSKVNAIIGSLGSLKKKNRDDVLQALITGQSYYPQQQAQNPGNSIGGIISAIGGAAGPIASLFSDQRLKENIRYLGDDRDGRGVYEYNYKGSRKLRQGHIAQEILARDRNGGAVFVDTHSGFLKLNPARLASI